MNSRSVARVVIRRCGHDLGRRQVKDSHAWLPARLPLILPTLCDSGRCNRIYGWGAMGWDKRAGLAPGTTSASTVLFDPYTLQRKCFRVRVAKIHALLAQGVFPNVEAFSPGKTA